MMLHGDQQGCGEIPSLPPVIIPQRWSFAHLDEPADEETNRDRKQQPTSEKAKHRQHGLPP